MSRRELVGLVIIVVLWGGHPQPGGTPDHDTVATFQAPHGITPTPRMGTVDPEACFGERPSIGSGSPACRRPGAARAVAAPFGDAPSTR